MAEDDGLSAAPVLVIELGVAGILFPDIDVRHMRLLREKIVFRMNSGSAVSTIDLNIDKRLN
jgi:hypothetical protein